MKMGWFVVIFNFSFLYIFSKLYIDLQCNSNSASGPRVIFIFSGGSRGGSGGKRTPPPSPPPPLPFLNVL